MVIENLCNEFRRLWDIRNDTMAKGRVEYRILKGKGLIVHEYSGHTFIAVVGVVLSLKNCNRDYIVTNFPRKISGIRSHTHSTTPRLGDNIFTYS